MTAWRRTNTENKIIVVFFLEINHPWAFFLYLKCGQSRDELQPTALKDAIDSCLLKTVSVGTVKIVNKCS